MVRQCALLPSRVRSLLFSDAHCAVAQRGKWCNRQCAGCKQVCDDRCANPRNLFRPFHAPYPSKIPEIEDTQKIVINYIYFKISNLKMKLEYL